MKHWLLGLWFLGIGVAQGQITDLGIREKDTIRLSIKEISSGSYVDGIGNNEFRVVAKLQLYHKPKGKVETAFSPSTLAYSRKFYVETNSSEVNPANADIEISGSEILRIIRNYQASYDLTQAKLLLVLEEVDPLMSDVVADTLVSFDGLDHSTFVAEDWAGEPRSYTYEVEVDDYTYMWVPDGNGGGYMQPLYLGSHKEKRTRIIGGGSRARAVIQADLH